MSTGGQFGGLEATPLFRDGVLYFTADYARTFAVDAKSGNILWRYEPEYGDGFNAMLCCGPIHRGVALAGDLVIVARLDARLVALNRADGKVVWEAPIDDWKRGVTTNSAPLVVKDHVIIGVSGGEYGVRGYLKSFDAKTGKLEWTDLHHSGARRARQRDLAQGRQLEDRRRPDLADGELRRRHRHALLGRRQSRLLAVGPASGRQSLDRLDAGARPEHRQDQMGLPVHAERRLGL